MPAKKKSWPSTKRCSICKSPLRQEADDRILASEPTEKVAAWLTRLGLKVSGRQVREHRMRHLRVTERAREILAERDAPQEGAAMAVVADVDTIDKACSIALHIATRLYPKLEGGGVAAPDAYLYHHSLKLIVDCAKARHEILNGTKINISGLQEAARALTPADAAARIRDAFGQHATPRAELAETNAAQSESAAGDPGLSAGPAAGRIAGA